jgi:hypothetical protein
MVRAATEALSVCEEVEVGGSSHTRSWTRCVTSRHQANHRTQSIDPPSSKALTPPALSVLRAASSAQLLRLAAHMAWKGRCVWRGPHPDVY